MLVIYFLIRFLLSGREKRIDQKAIYNLQWLKNEPQLHIAVKISLSICYKVFLH